MANTFNISMAPALAAVQTVVDAIRAEDVIAITNAIVVVDGLVDKLEEERLMRSVVHMSEEIEAGLTLSDVVNITDKGVLTGVSATLGTFTAEGQAQIIVTLDGGALPVITIDFEKKADNISLDFNHRFDTSLRVQHKITEIDKGTLKTYVMYTTD